MRPSYLKRRELIACIFYFLHLRCPWRTQIPFSQPFIFSALRLRSQVSLRSNIKAPKRCEPSIRKVLFHCRPPSSCLEWMITIPWKPFFATNRATSFPVPLKMELSECIQCRSWSRKITLKSCWSNARKCRLGVLCKDRLGHPLPEPRNAIFRVLYNKNRPVSGDMESLEQLLISA